MYLVIDDPEVVNVLGEVVPNGLLHREEISPTPVLPNIRLIKSIWTQRVLIDDETRALFRR